MKKSKFAFRLLSLTMTIVLIFGIFGSSVYAADESDYIAEFRIETDKTSAKAGEDVTVSVYLKTNYYIFAASLVVIYDYQKLTLQNTSDNASSFLSFEGSMADAYSTNGNWKNTEQLFNKRNSNIEFWSSEAAKNQYKAVYATWAGDSSISELLMLEEEEIILSFVVRANEDIEDFSELVFISHDFLKTSSVPQGTLFVGRSLTNEIDVSTAVQTGQTVIYHGIDPTVCNHVAGNWEIITPSTCTEDGIKVKKCTLCGIKLSEEIVYRIGHRYVAIEKLPTCTEDGFTTYTCANCGDSYTGDYVTTSGHKIVTDEAVSPDCVNSGLTEGSHCDACGEVIAEQEVVDALGHTEETITSDATCTEDGFVKVNCTVCGEVFSEEVIPAKGHTEGRVEIKEPTTAEDGLKTTYCDVCGEVISEEVLDKIAASINAAPDTNTVIDREQGYIYGLDVGAESLDGFVTVEGYTLEYTYFNDMFGTGTRVDCILDGEVKETYYIIIFGDLSGDGVIDIYDVSVYAAVVNGEMELDETFSFAADIFDVGAVDTYDYMLVASVVNGESEISQTR